jgi:peptidoglycan/LPS O-acetylase OafA/YrhL
MAYMKNEGKFLSRLRRSTSGTEFIPVIDGLRFLAILPVVMQHVCERVIRISEERHLATVFDYFIIHLLPSGYLGVELFFTISGLIISYPFIGAHLQGERYPSMRKFYLRRVTRIEPPYFLAMIGCYLFIRVTGYVPEATQTFSSTSTSLEASLAASLVYMHWLFLGGFPKLNPPAWSLEVEVQFYLLAPILVLAILRLRRLLPVIVGILALIAASIVARYVTESRFVLWHELPLTKFLYLFLTGMFVNVVTCGGLVPQRIPPSAWDAGFVIAAIILYVIDKCEASVLAAWAQVACYVVLFVGAFEGAFFRRLLSSTWIFTIGGMCYTIYLIHLPILETLTGIVMRTSGFTNFIPGLLISVVITLPILFAVSVAFFLLIEKPCMNPKWPLQARNWIAGRAVADLTR